MTRATFTVGVFGLACCNDVGTLRIKVNVRGDQERQRQLIGLPADSLVKIIDMPGGGVELEDFLDPKQASLLEVLRREIAEETGGCTIDPLAEDFSGPVIVVTNIQDSAKPTGDLAFWIPILLQGHPQPSSEAVEHPWISLAQLQEETEYRAVGGLGKAGRTGQMMRSAFRFYEAHRADPAYFSVPKVEP